MCDTAIEVLRMDAPREWSEFRDLLMEVVPEGHRSDVLKKFSQLWVVVGMYHEELQHQLRDLQGRLPPDGGNVH